MLLLDGAMGTELRARGVRVPDHVTSAWSALSLDEAPEAVVGVHRDHLAAGAEVITADNYAVTRPLLARVGLDDRLDELTHTAVDLAVRARDEAGAGDRPVRVAASLPPLETSYRADLVLPDEVLADEYGHLARLLAPRVDILLCETMASAREARAAARAAVAAADAAPHRPEVWVSWTLQGNRPGRLPSGETVEAALSSVLDLPVDAHLVNCCGANFVAEAVRRLRNLTDTPLGGYANSSHVDPLQPGEPPVAPDQVEHVPQTALDVEGYAAEVAGWLDQGATIVGGCCYTTPDHTARLRRLLDDRAG